MGVPARRSAAGIGAAALWGMLLESIVWALGQDDSLARVTRMARLQDAFETGIFTAGTALIGSLICASFPPLRRRLAARPVWIPSAFGLAASVALAITFLWAPPQVTQIRLSEDPLLLRSTQCLVGLAAGALVAISGLYLRPPAWIHGVHVLAVGLGLAMMLGPGTPSRDKDVPDIFLISIDTLRADHLGCYGYPLPTSPEIDALCEESVVYESAMAPAASTIPSYTSLMSGTLQNSHGVYTNFDKADDSTQMIAEHLRQVGFRTAAILEGTFPGSFANVGQGFDLLIQRGVVAAAPVLTPSAGIRSLLRGAIAFVSDRFAVDLSVTTWSIERWLRSLPEGAPVFAHFYWPYPHTPYAPPARYLQLVPDRTDLPVETRETVHLYDAEIRYADAQVGRLIDALKDLGRYDDAWVIFTSDHGEELGRLVDDSPEGSVRFFGHTRYLFDSSVRVPLIVKPPQGLGVEPSRESGVVTTASLASTLLRTLGLDAGEALVGPLPGLGIRGEASGIAFSVARNPSRSFDRASVRRGSWRLIENRVDSSEVVLLRYSSDGSESDDLSREAPETARELQVLLRTLHPDGETDGGDRPSLPERELRMLEELGYVE